MRLGIGLPSWMGNAIEPRVVLDWATRAEALGFDAVAVHDRPDHEAWDPLATLAAVAAVTERVRLATAAIVLPARDEALIAKQAAVVDRLSGGRLDLGVVLGGRAADLEVLGRPFAGRGRAFVRQLARLDGLWAQAVATEATGTALGPAPIQRPRPPLWVGGYQPSAIERALRYGDAYLFGAPGLPMIADRIPDIRRQVTEAGRADFEIGGLAYVLPDPDAAAMAAGEQALRRYYGTLNRPFAEMVASGDRTALASTIAGYRDAGLDVLHLIPVGVDVAQLTSLAPLIDVAARR